MDTAQRAVVAAVSTIVAVTLLSGPLVGAVDLTTESGTGISDELGEGSAEVSVESLPTDLTISEGRYGSEQFFLRVPDATVRLSNVTGQPLLKYNIRIEDLGYSSGTTLFISAEQEGTNRLSLTRSTFDAGEIRQDSYEATLSVSLRANGTERVVRERAVVVEVER